MKFQSVLVCSVLLFSLTAVDAAYSEIFIYNDEGSYLSKLDSLGYQAVHEGFEDDLAWGAVRSTISGGFQALPSVSNLGITWTSNFGGGGVTTGNGPARTGDWGFYAYPHGDQINGIVDGFVGTSESPIYGVGGWIETNTTPAGISLFLDSVSVDFNGNDNLNNAHAFFGAINTDGFTRFDYLETESEPGDQKLIFADDFTFGFAQSIPEPGSFVLLLVASFSVFVSRNRNG